MLANYTSGIKKLFTLDLLVDLFNLKLSEINSNKRLLNIINTVYKMIFTVNFIFNHMISIMA